MLGAFSYFVDSLNTSEAQASAAVQVLAPRLAVLWAFPHPGRLAWHAAPAHPARSNHGVPCMPPQCVNALYLCIRAS